MTDDPQPEAQPETAHALSWRHGLPEDVIDGALCLHAQELVAVQRDALRKTDDPVFYEGEARRRRRRRTPLPLCRLRPRPPPPSAPACRSCRAVARPASAPACSSVPAAMSRAARPTARSRRPRPPCWRATRNGPAVRAGVLREALGRLRQVPFTNVLTELRRMVDCHACEAGIEHDGGLPDPGDPQLGLRLPDGSGARGRPEPHGRRGAAARDAGRRPGRDHRRDPPRLGGRVRAGQRVRLPDRLRQRRGPGELPRRRGCGRRRR